MNIQTAYPVFEASQVLTSTQLNDLAEYLEQQDRLSRRALDGIGVACGFHVDAEGGTVAITKGVAVTSEGFLICADAQVYDRFRPYEVPVPTAEEASEADIAEARYPYLFPDGETQIPVFELLDTDFAPAPGEADPEVLSAAFLADKTVMLFLECRLESLKNCNINDCSDKGAERRFTLRRLLVTRAQADAMIAREAEIAGRPVDRNTHPGNELPYLRIEKLALARTGVGSYAELLGRVLTIALKLATQLPQALRGAYAAYEHLLGDLYADGEDPFPDTYFSNVWGQLALNIFMAQYFYDYMRDVAMAYNEFVEAAAGFEAECLPNPDRFPKHVLIGDATDRPDAFTTTFPTAADVLAFDHLGATTGAGLRPRPAPRRTHFVPSPAAVSRPRLEEVRSLFRRMHLLALTYRTQSLMQAPIRLTPSRWREAPLSERAIPFHYAFTPGADLHLDWSWRKTKARLLSTVYAYRFSLPDDAHPLHFRLDDQDFVRVEGIVGKPLGSAMAELIAYKKALGLSFAIEPVFMRLAAGPNDQAGIALDQKAAADAVAAARKLLLCRFSDLDVIFLVLIGAIFAFLVLLIQRLGRLPTTPGRPGVVVTDDLTVGPVAPERATPFLNPATAARFRLNLTPEAEAQLKADSDRLRADLKKGTFERGDIVARLAPDAAPTSAAGVFAVVKDDAGGGNLFDRTRAFVKDQGGDEAAALATYAMVAPLHQSEQLMDALNVDSIVDFDEEKFATAYRGFADSYQNYAEMVRANPTQDPKLAQEQLQIAAAADNVASQTGAFAAANIRTELNAAIQGLFESLTLEGYARRHPGLEHHAGVPVGGTLVLFYVALADLAAQAAPILRRLDTSVTGLGTSLAQGAEAVALPGAFQELAAAVADRTNDVLDNFVVLFDAMTPYQCCDTDCSDVVLSERIIADPFGDDVDPGPMAVPPLDFAKAPRPASNDFIGRDIDSTIRRPVAVGGFAVRGLTNRVEPFVRPPRPTPVDEEPVEPEPAPGDQREAIVFGVVGVELRGQVRPLAESEVVFTTPDGSEAQRKTDNGTFKIAVPAGTIRIRGTSPGHRGTTQSVTLTPGEERELTLVVVPQR